MTGFLRFVSENTRWLAGGFLLTLFSTVGQTIFISLSAGEIRAEYGLSHGGWGVVYMIGTLASALTLPTLGKVVDRYSVRRVVLFVMPMLALAAALMALALGWRTGWWIAAGMLLVALPLVATLIAVDRTPRATDPAPRVVDARDWTRAEVLRDPIFYLAMTGIMAPGFIVTVALFHQVYLIELRGWSLEVFASAFVVWAGVNSVFTILSGQLIDRFSGVVLLPFALLPLGAAVIVLGTVEAHWAPFAFMALTGMSNGLSTTLFGAVWAEIYGLKHLGSIRALIVSAGVLASAAGPGLTGYLIDAGVSFPGQLVAMGIYCLLISLVMLYVSRQVRGRALPSQKPLITPHS